MNIILKWNDIHWRRDAQKMSFRASKRLQKFRTRKTAKKVNYAEIEKLKETMVGAQVE